MSTVHDYCPEIATLPSLGDGDKTDNVWWSDTICLLDTLTVTQVTYILERSQRAKDDLKRATTCQDLLCLADEVPLLPTMQEDDHLMKVFGEQVPLPYYQLFRGNLNNM